MPLDPVSSLILDEAGPLAGRVLVLDDVAGALTGAALDAGADVRTWCDDLRDLMDVPAPQRLLGGPAADWTADTVLWRLPKAVAAVEDYAEQVSLHLSAGGRVVAGGRTAAMTPAQNDALRRSFVDVHASRGRQKSRVLHAADPRPGQRRWPQRRYLPEVGVMVVAHGAVFNTNRLDDGTHLLLRTLERAAGGVNEPGRCRGTALDLGCGSGVITVWLAQRGWSVTGVDVSASAVASTRLTARANGVQVGVRRADGLVGTRAGSLDLLVSNPPFHRGTAKDTTATHGFIRDAASMLRPGGELWLVFNSHLPYLAALRQHVGVTTVEAQDRHYRVTRTLRADQ